MLEPGSPKRNFASLNFHTLIWELSLNVLSVDIALFDHMFIHKIEHVVHPVVNAILEDTWLQLSYKLAPLIHVLVLEIDPLKVRWDGHDDLKIPEGFPVALHQCIYYQIQIKDFALA